MKRVALLTVFFYVCTFSAPQRIQAAVPVAFVAAAAIGAVMVSTSAGTYYAQTGQAPEYVKVASDAVASAADAVFQPSYLAQAVGYLFTPESLTTAKDYYASKAASVGASLADIIDHVGNSASTAYSDLKALLAEKIIDNEDTPQTVPAGTIVSTPSGNFWMSGTTPSNGGAVTMASWLAFKASYPKVDGMDAVLWKHAIYNDYKIFTISKTTTNGYYTYLFWEVYPTTGAVNWNTPDPETDFPGLADALANPSPAVASDLRDAIKALPDDKKIITEDTPATVGQATPAPTLTSAEISQLLKDNAAAVARAAAEAAQAVAAANPADAAAQVTSLQLAATAAQAAADAVPNPVEQPQEETFSPISDSAFTEPYNPGEFNIPARFTQFLNNVKSSGLFSFSNDFFNSLPGGGSPVYEIEAGQYGHHTIDLSDTLSTGLAVLKTILLVCFGFLSIRAVIMKR